MIYDLNSAFNKCIRIYFADDNYLSYTSKKLRRIESVMSYELKKNQLHSLDPTNSPSSRKCEIDIFHPVKKKELDEITLRKQFA